MNFKRHSKLEYSFLQITKLSRRSIFSPISGKTQNKSAIGAHWKQLFGMTLPSGGEKYSYTYTRKVKYLELVTQVTKVCWPLIPVIGTIYLLKKKNAINSNAHFSNPPWDHALKWHIQLISLCFKMTHLCLVISTSYLRLRNRRAIIFISLATCKNRNNTHVCAQLCK